jgi:hypothetical protein
MTDWRRTTKISIPKVRCKNNKCTPCNEKSYMGMVEKVRNSINIKEGVPRRPQGSVSSEGAELPSQFRPNNEADQYDEDDDDNSSDEALLIHPIITHLDPPDRRISA